MTINAFILFIFCPKRGSAEVKWKKEEQNAKHTFVFMIYFSWNI